MRRWLVGGIVVTAAALSGCSSRAEQGHRVSLSTPTPFIEGRTTRVSASIIDISRTQGEIAELVEWSLSGTTAAPDPGRPVLAFAELPDSLVADVMGLHVGEGRVTVNYLGTLVTLNAPVFGVTAQTVTVPSSVTVAVGQTVTVTPVFRDSVDVVVHRHTPTWTVADPAVAEVLAVANSEPQQFQIRGKASGSTTATITAQNATGTIAVTVP